MAENNNDDASQMSFEDFIKATGHPAAQEPNHKVIPPTKSKVADDPLAEAFMAHGSLALMVMAIGGGDGEKAHEQMQDLALDAAARFRGRVVAGEISL